MTHETRTAGSAAAEAALWGPRARDWADAMEWTFKPLYDEVFERIAVGPGVHLLDVGCGAGLALVIAAELGAAVTGIDATEALLAIARERLPGANLRAGEMEDLRYEDGAFDVVTGFNSFQYAVRPVAALREAKRVARKGGSVVVGVWGRPEETEAAAYLKALGGLLPPPPPGKPGPFALSAEGALAALAAEAGLEPVQEGAVPCPWEYPDLDTTLRGLLSAGPAVRAIKAAGEERVREAVAAAIEPYCLPSGGYRMENRFRYVIASA
jgi:SAM-dependent methyltransferase